MDEDLYLRFSRRAGLGAQSTSVEIVEAVRAIPHGRPRERSARGVVEDWRGTCSTKHLLLRQLLPEADIGFVHRVFLLTREDARRWLGDDVAEVVPPGGMVDVHTYATGLIDGQRVTIDVTFPTDAAWDGNSDMPIPFPDGEDFDAGDDPIASKEELVRRKCDPQEREALIRAISLPKR